MHTTTGNIPRIPLNLYEHKLVITIRWTILLLTSCILPILLFFVLKYVAHAKDSLYIGVSSAVFGAVSFPSFLKRFYDLFKKRSNCRPLGVSNRWALDYFEWNFLFGIIYVTILIVVASASKPAIVRIVCLPLSLLLFQVCTQLLVGLFFMAMKVRYPFRFSSMPQGETVRPPLYTIIEDIVAVDGGQGTEFRTVWNQRYEASEPIRTLLYRMTLFWGVTGLAIAIMDTVLIFTLSNVDYSWAIGWAVPWIFAAIAAVVTLFATKAALRREGSLSNQTMEDAEISGALTN